MRLLSNISIVISLTIVLLGCGEAEKPIEVKQTNWGSKKSSSMHKELALEEDIRIRAYLERHKEYKFESTGSGLRYSIYKNGDQSIPVAEGDIVCLEIDIRMMEGDKECYRTEEDECRQIKIDKSDAETGLIEAVRNMHLGDEAKLIVPYHLAHGLLGDRDKILPLATLIMDVKVVEIEK